MEQSGEYIGNFAILFLLLFQSVDLFVDKLHWEETDSEKCDKIHALKQDVDKWQHVSTLIGLLSVCTTYIHSEQSGIFDMLLICWQCSRSIFLWSSIYSMPSSTCPRSPSQGMVNLCQKFKVQMICPCPWSCMYKGQWILWEDNRLTCLYHGHGYVFQVVPYVDEAANTATSPQPKEEDGLLQKTLVNQTPGRCHAMY